ncbi:MAG: nucleotidyltransferase domain-containing protein [Candidatus Edwardsbacteria bacterium]
MNKKNIVTALKNFFKENASLFNIDMAFLYGSWARGYPRKDSDVDIALVFLAKSSNENITFKILTDISFELSMKVKKEVNIISISWDFVKPLVSYNAIVLGLPLYIKDFERYVALKNYAIVQMEDFRLFGLKWQLEIAERNLEVLRYA